jgi:hypothetical protein
MKCSNTNSVIISLFGYFESRIFYRRTANFLVYMVYPLHCSSCQCVYCLDCHSGDRKLTQLNYILTGKRRRGRKDQKLQSRMKLLRNLMETFIPWGIRSAFCRGEFPWITELTVTSGLYWENIDHPHHRDIFGCSSCGVAFFRTKYPNYSWYWTDICICFFMYLQMYSLSPLVQKYMKSMWEQMLLVSWEM